MIYVALTIYLIIFASTWVHLYRLIDTVCEEMYSELRREIYLRRIEGKDLNFEHLDKLAKTLVVTFRKHSMKRSVIQNSWLCFMIFTCSFTASDDFEEEFKVNFKRSSISEFLSGMSHVVNPDLLALKNILQTILNSLER